MHTKRERNEEIDISDKRSYQIKRPCTKQKSFLVSLPRKTKKKHYANLNQKGIADNKQFWRTVKPLVSDKS